MSLILFMIFATVSYIESTSNVLKFMNKFTELGSGYIVISFKCRAHVSHPKFLSGKTSCLVVAKCVSKNMT
jgi:hypothetical protein